MRFVAVVGTRCSQGQGSGRWFVPSVVNSAIHVFLRASLCWLPGVMNCCWCAITVTAGSRPCTRWWPDLLSQAVHREVLEETGLTLGKLKYCFSQSWPFPHSLMMGFHGEYSGGKLTIDEDELCFGGWFHRDNLPDLPPAFAIARKLVDLSL